MKRILAATDGSEGAMRALAGLVQPGGRKLSAPRGLALIRAPRATLLLALDAIEREEH